MNENNFTSCVWWPLTEEIASHFEEMAGEKEIACCVRGYHIFKDIWAAAIQEVLVCSTEPTNVGKIFIVKFIHVKYFRTFSVYENIFYNEKLRYAYHSHGTNTSHLLYLLILHRHRNWSRWSSHGGRTILSRSWRLCVVSFPDWINCCSKIRQGTYSVHKCTRNYDLHSVWLNFHFEAEVQWECLLTAKKKAGLKIFAVRFARELLTALPLISSWAWPSADCFQWPCF